MIKKINSHELQRKNSRESDHHSCREMEFTQSTPSLHTPPLFSLNTKTVKVGNVWSVDYVMTNQIREPTDGKLTNC